MRARDTFITDFGEPLQATLDGEPSFIVERYGVWVWDARKGKHQVEETSSDLEFLQNKYGPCEVVSLSKPN